MKSLESTQLSILNKIAKKQRLANLAFLLVLGGFLYMIQIGIDSKAGSLFQGSGRLVYWICGILLILVWWALSQRPSSEQSGFTYIIKNGEVLNKEGDHRIQKLLEAYYNVTKVLKIDPLSYNLTMGPDKIINAFATGLSRGKTIGVFSKTVDICTPTQLEAVIAHEFGHVINRDAAFAAVSKSISCGSGLLITFIGICIVWANWGFLYTVLFLAAEYGIFLLLTKFAPKLLNYFPGIITVAAVYAVWGWEAAILFYIVTTFVIPIASSLVSKATEEFADSFAASYGYGPAFIEFLWKIDGKEVAGGIFESHPSRKTRIAYVEKINAGQEGKVPDSVERWLWFAFKVAIVLIGAAYVRFYLQATLPVTSLFLATGGYFIVAENLLSGNSGSWHASLHPKKASETTKKIKAKDCLQVTLLLVLYAALYACGLYASYTLMHSSTGLIALLSLISFYAWIAKPFVSIIGLWNDLSSTVSDFITYYAVLVSIVMMVSFLVTIIL